MRRRSRQKRFRQPASGRVQRLNHDGLAVVEECKPQARPRPVVVHGALPGEEVQFTVHERKREVDLALLDHTDGSHPQRVAPPCPHFLNCSGCVLQHFAPAAQIEFKEQVLRELLEAQGLCAETWLPPICGPTKGYRRKARLALRWVAKKNRLLVGFREIRDGRFVAELEGCSILAPPLDNLIPLLSQTLGELSIADRIPQIEYAAGDSQAGIVLRILAPLSDEDRQRLQSLSEQSGLKLWVQPEGLDSIQDLEGRALQSDAPPLHYRIDSDALELGFAPANFVQVNRQVNEAMIAAMIEKLDVQEGDRVLDLFCGLGNLTLPLARRCAEVVGVEADEQLLALARQNATANGLSRARFVRADLYAETLDPAIDISAYEKVVLDPPRSGAAGVVRALAAASARRVLYIACGPEAMVKDMAELVQAGFVIESMRVMDMFPHTRHFESMALLTRG